jgi:hypothetical protein
MANNEMSEIERQDLVELRSRLSDILSTDTNGGEKTTTLSPDIEVVDMASAHADDWTLLRFLQARQHDVGKAEQIVIVPSCRNLLDTYM